MSQGHSISPHSHSALCGLLGLGLLVGTAAFAAEPQVFPSSTRAADTQSSVSLSGNLRYFSDFSLEQGGSVEGWPRGLDLRVPFGEGVQARVYLPAQSEEEMLARQAGVELGRRADGEGYGDSLDLPSVELEHQLMFEEGSGYNLGYYLGVGGALDSLDAGTSRQEDFSGQGNNLLAGITLDRGFGSGLRLMGNVGLRHYWQSDDLSFQHEDTFSLADLKGAILFKPAGGKVYSTLELTYLGEFSEYNAVTLIPEMVIPLTPNLEFKAALPIGLTGDGDQLGGTTQFGYRF